MKKIIGICVALLIILVLLGNMFTFYHYTMRGEMCEEGRIGSYIAEREVEIWGIRYNPVWYQAFVP